MVKIPIGAIARNVLDLAKANATPIATGAVIIGILSAVVLAVKAGKESTEIVEEYKEETGVEELSKKGVIKLVWTRFIPVALIVILTIACLVVNTSRMMKRCAALSTACALSESYLKDYMDSTKETIGEKKEQAIRDSAIEKQASRNLPKEDAPRGIIETGNGTTLFYDAITTRYFRSDMEKVRRAEETLANIYYTEGEVSLDDYTQAIGLGKYSDAGSYLGWKRADTFDKLQKYHFNYTTSMYQNGEPYIAIHHDDNRLTVIH